MLIYEDRRLTPTTGGREPASRAGGDTGIGGTWTAALPTLRMRFLCGSLARDAVGKPAGRLSASG